MPLTFDRFVETPCTYLVTELFTHGQIHPGKKKFGPHGLLLNFPISLKIESHRIMYD